MEKMKTNKNDCFYFKYKNSESNWLCSRKPNIKRIILEQVFKFKTLDSVSSCKSLKRSALNYRNKLKE